MGQKVNPHGMRVGVIKDWDSRWFADKKNFGNQLVEGLFVGEEGEDVDEVDAGLGKVGIMIDDVEVVHTLHIDMICKNTSFF